MIPGCDVLDNEEFLQCSHILVEGAAYQRIIIRYDIGKNGRFIGERRYISGIGSNDSPGNLGVQFLFGRFRDILIADGLYRVGELLASHHGRRQR